MLNVNKWWHDLFISWLILNCNEWLIHYITFLIILTGISALVCYYNSVLDRFWTTELHKLISTGSDRSTYLWFVQTLRSTIAFHTDLPLELVTRQTYCHLQLSLVCVYCLLCLANVAQVGLFVCRQSVFPGMYCPADCHCKQVTHFTEHCTVWHAAGLEWQNQCCWYRVCRWVENSVIWPLSELLVINHVYTSPICILLWWKRPLGMGHTAKKINMCHRCRLMVNSDNNLPDKQSVILFVLVNFLTCGVRKQL